MIAPGPGARRKAKSSAGKGEGRQGATPAGAVRTLEWVGGYDGHLEILDQTLLPGRCEVLRIRDVEGVWQAIRRLAVRGAPAIGIAAAYGVVLGVRGAARGSSPELLSALDAAADRLATARPTAVDLFWALERMRARGKALVGDGVEPVDALAFLLDEALAIHQEDAEACQAIGRHGARLIADGACVLTHCNAGALATGGIGTALAPVYAAQAAGKRVAVFADETRPLLQGARLTAWELERAGVDVTVICDGMAARVLGEGKVDCAIVGADRIAANGDTANKIGTYGVALLARAHGVPFYVAAPSSTFDLSLSTGAAIPIEERDGDEVRRGFGRDTTPPGMKVYNPAFDVTPARLVTAFITERGLIRPPYRRSISTALRR